VTVNIPPLVVTDGSVCVGGSIDLATLVTNSGGGTLSYYTTLAAAQAGTGALASTTVSPTSATNYYVRSTSSEGCFTVAELTISQQAPACNSTTVTGPN
jgi:Ig-like domain CHU_C associated